jgi:hypothetical protein
VPIPVRNPVKNRYHGKWAGRLCSRTDKPGMINETIMRRAAKSSSSIKPLAKCKK